MLLVLIDFRYTPLTVPPHILLVRLQSTDTVESKKKKISLLTSKKG
jgi:hypothetical protein